MMARLLSAVALIALCAATATAQDAAPTRPAVSGTAEQVPPATTPAPPPTTAPAPATPAPAPQAQPPAPTKIRSSARIYIEPDEFGMAFTAAIQRKEVPVVVMTNKEKVDFFVQTIGAETQQSTATKVTKIIMFGSSGDRFDATVTITNRDGAVVFARMSKRAISRTQLRTSRRI